MIASDQDKGICERFLSEIEHFFFHIRSRDGMTARFVRGSWFISDGMDYLDDTAEGISSKLCTITSRQKQNKEITLGSTPNIILLSLPLSLSLSRLLSTARAVE